MHHQHPEVLVELAAVSRLPTRHGEFSAYVYRSLSDGTEHMALVAGIVAGQSGVLVRLHSECLTGDVLGSLRCDCGQQLEMALSAVGQAGCGVVLYLRGQEGRGIGLAHKIKAYGLQDLGRDTVEANLDLGLPIDTRSYDVAAQILLDLKIRSVRLMSNNPRKIAALEKSGLPVIERIPLHAVINSENHRYLLTKQQKLGHLLNIDEVLPKA